MTNSWLSRCIDSPVGTLQILAQARGVAAILWGSDSPQCVPAQAPLSAGRKIGGAGRRRIERLLLETERQLAEYFAGERAAFTLELAFATGSAFQRRVWGALLAIPYGQTRSYGQLARQIGAPKAARAVGAAIGSNPLAIVVPCHRVLGACGELTGFAGGLDAKARLLALEAAH
jgi:methylated-DNA-[protein]-cysteine S-methyltransferase